jgi:glutamine amidotransferase
MAGMGLVAIIDYGSGNLCSAEKALWAAAGRADLRRDIRITDDPDLVATADYIVLPGVGAYGDCAAGLRARPGLIDAMTHTARARARPFLGICVGAQLLSTRGLEHGAHDGLDWIAGETTRLDLGGGARTLPHMGWNEVKVLRTHPLFEGLGAAPAHFYFANSYAVTPLDPAHLLAESEHGAPFAAAIASDTLAGVQFHPEKSQAAGLGLLANFLSWAP